MEGWLGGCMGEEEAKVPALKLGARKAGPGASRKARTANAPKRRNLLGSPRSRAHVSPTLSNWPQGSDLLLGRLPAVHLRDSGWAHPLPVWADRVSPWASQLIPACLSVSGHVGQAIPVPGLSPPSTAPTLISSA